MSTPEESAREFVEDFLLDDKERRALIDLIRARDAEVRAEVLEATERALVNAYNEWAGDSRAYEAIDTVWDAIYSGTQRPDGSQP